MDEVLLQRILNKDEQAFEDLYNQYSAYANRVALAVTRNSALASDAVQETFIRVYYNMDKFKLGGPFEPWFYRILVNECKRTLSRRPSVSYISEYLENELDISHEETHDFEEYEVLYKEIEKLSDKIRIPIILKYLKGFKEKEIAEILNLKLNTVKSRLYKGRQKLKDAMTDLK